MKNTLCLSYRCNLACSYCYMPKGGASMSAEVASRAVDFAYARALPGEEVSFGMFGGEPLLDFGQVREVAGLIAERGARAGLPPRITVVTNGTIVSDDILDFCGSDEVFPCLSCDGPPDVHDRFRRFRDGGGSSATVERNIRRFLEAVPDMPVNSVVRPETVEEMPRTVEYLLGIGVRKIYANPDFSADWRGWTRERLRPLFQSVAETYVNAHRSGSAPLVSPLQTKISVLLKGGYGPADRCRMGKAEFAYAPDGSIYPCERLMGPGPEAVRHKIGDVFDGLSPSFAGCRTSAAEKGDSACAACGIKNYCMNWCGCSNHMSTGRYDRVGPFVCAWERASIEAAARAFETLNRELGLAYLHRLAARDETLP